MFGRQKRAEAKRAAENRAFAQHRDLVEAIDNNTRELRRIRLEQAACRRLAEHDARARENGYGGER